MAFVGFEIKKNILDFNNFQIDLSSFKKSKSMFAVDTKIEKLVSGLICEKLDLTHLNELEIDGKTLRTEIILLLMKRVRCLD